MNTSHYPYLNMLCQDASGIHVENWRESWSVDMHCHDYYELMLVSSGSCRHVMHGSKTLLIPGDAILIPRHVAHGYELNAEISLYNCQFRPESLDPEVVKLLKAWGEAGQAGKANRISEDNPNSQNNLDSQNNPDCQDGPDCQDNQDCQGGQEASGAFWQKLIAQREDMHADSLTAYEINSSKQGVLHLTPSQLAYMVALLEHILDQKKATGSDSSLLDSTLLKQKYTEIILIEMHHAIQNQNHRHAAYSAANQKIIAEILADIEAHLSEPFDITQVAQKYSFSPNYLRKLFKDFTGVPPIQYVNRLRIIYACECMEQLGMDSKNAAESVGIYDMNYFSRLFKQIMGYTPSNIAKTAK